MKRKRLPLPTVKHRVKPKPINIPTYWSPEQATAVLEFLEELRDRVLGHYEVEIYEFLRHDRVTTAPFKQSDIDESDVPF